MLRYIKLDESNINLVAKNYMDYYNKNEEGCWKLDKAYKRIHQMMTMENSLSYLQYDDDKFTGFLLGYYKEYDDLTSFYIEEIVIMKDFQDKEYGTSLIKKVIKEATENGAKHIELISVNDSHHLHFYEKQGFFKATNLILMGKNID